MQIFNFNEIEEAVKVAVDSIELEDIELIRDEENEGLSKEKIVSLIFDSINEEIYIDIDYSEDTYNYVGHGEYSITTDYDTQRLSLSDVVTDYAKYVGQSILDSVRARYKEIA